MKHIFRFLFLTLLLSAVCLTALSAADVAFVSGNGTGDGTAAATPTSSMAAAYTLLGEDGGTVVFVGEYATTATVDFPAHAAKVKLTSVWNGTDYRKTNDASLRFKGTGFVKFNSPTEIDSLTVKLDKSSAGFCANFHPFTIGYDFAVVNTDGTNAYRMYLVGGQNGENKGGALAAGATNEIKVYSGKFIMVSAFSRSIALVHNGSVTVTLGGTADVRDMYFGAMSTGAKGGTGIVRLTENAKVTNAYLSGNTVGMTGSAILHMSGNTSVSTFKNSAKTYFPSGTRELYYTSTVALPEGFESHFDTVTQTDAVSGDLATAYVSDSGNGDGTTEDTPINTLAGAYALLGEDGGNIVLVGDTTVANALVLEEKSGAVTVTASGDAKLILTGSIALAQNTNGTAFTFDLPIEADGGAIYGGFRNVTFGENCTVTGTLDFYGGTLSSSEEDADNQTVITTLPYTVTVKNGTFRHFAGGICRATYTDMVGSVAAPLTVNISGGNFTDSFSLSGGSILADDVTLNISGGTFACPIYVRSVNLSTQAKAARLSPTVTSDRAYYAMDGDVAITISGGNFTGGLISAHDASVAYTQLLRGNFTVDIKGGTFAEDTVLDATQVKAYAGENKSAVLTYPDSYTFTVKRFDSFNGETVTYDEPLRVAFVGDSITEGVASSDPLTKSYPAVFTALAKANGCDIVVANYGVSASGLLPTTSVYYPERLAYPLLLEETDADYVVVGLGTNDHLASSRGGLRAGYIENYTDFIETLGTLPDTKKVFMTSAILSGTQAIPGASQLRIRSVIVPLQRKMATEFAKQDSEKYVFVDLFGLTLPCAKEGALLSGDRVHPKDTGYAAMGSAMYNAVFNGVTVPTPDYHRYDIYLSENGTEFGAGTKEDPTSRIDIAFSMIPAGESATVHIDGTITHSAAIVIPLGAKKITLVGEGDGATLELLADGDTVWINSDVKFDNLTLKGASASTIIGNYHDVEFTETTVLAGTWSFFAGICSYNVADAAFPYDTEATTSSAEDCTVVLNGSGTLNHFALGNYRVAKAAPIGTYSGNLTASVGDRYSVGGTILGAVGQNYLTGTVSVSLPYGFALADYAPIGNIGDPIVYDTTKNTGTVTVTNREAPADTDVVFVSASGSGDGVSLSAPTSDLAAAYALLGENGGTVVFVGEYATTATVNFPMHTAPVKLTSVWDGIDYRETNNASIRFKGTGFIKFNGPTEIDGLTVKLDKSSAGFCANFHALTIGYDFSVVNTDGTTDYRMYLVGGQNGDADIGTLDAGETNEIKIYSGRFIMASGFSRNVAFAHTGTVKLTVGGTADIRDLYLGTLGTGSKGGATELSLAENAKVKTLYLAGNTSMTGSATVSVSDNASIESLTKTDKTLFPSGTRTLNIESYTTVSLPAGFADHFDTVNIATDTVTVEKPLATTTAENVLSLLADGKAVYYTAKDTENGIAVSYPQEFTSFTMLVAFDGDVYTIAEYAVTETVEGITATLIGTRTNDGSVAYVGGDGNGLAPEMPASTFAEAFALLGEDGGTIVVVDETVPVRTDVPAHSGKVTVTSVYGGIDYRESGAKIAFPTESVSFYLGGETVFTDITLDIPTTALICAQFHPITFDTGVVVNADYSADANGLYLIGGDNLGANDTSVTYDKDTRIVLRSGSFSRVVGFSRYSGARNHTGTAYITVENGTYIRYLSTGATGNSGTANKAVVTLKDTVTVENLIIGGGEKTNYMHGEVVINVDEMGGGIIQEIDVMGLYNNKGGVTLNYDKSTAPDGLLFLAALAKFDKIQTTCIRDGAHAYEAETVSPFDEAMRIRSCSACGHVEILSELPDTAYEGVVFVADGGFGDGSHPALPLGSYADAMNTLGKDGGTIVLVGETTLTHNYTYKIGSDPAFFQEPTHTGAILVTSVFGDADYREKGAKLIFGSNIHYKLSGDTTFDGIVFDAAAGVTENIIAARYNKLLFGKDVQMLKTLANGYTLGIVGGYQYFRYTDYVDVYIENEYLRFSNQAVQVDTFELPDSKTINIDVATGDSAPAYLREEAAKAFDSMFEAMAAEGLEMPTITSGMQTYEFKYDYITRFWARTWRAHPDWNWDRVFLYVTKSTGLPGYSEHHLGLAVDMYDITPDFETDSPNHDYDKTKEWAWILENGKNYGIILRYPENGTAAVTGCISENWHFRYVGVEHATAIMENSTWKLLENYVGEYIGLFDQDADVTLLGGTYAFVVGGSKDAANEDVTFTGKNYVTIGENATVGEITDVDVHSGDANGDGVLSLADVIRTLKCTADATVSVTAGADMNEDGEISIVDVLLILKAILNA